MLFILAMYQILTDLNLRFIKSFVFSLFLTASIPFSFGQHSYANLLSEGDNVKKAEIGLFLLNEYRRNHSDSLKFLAINLLINASGGDYDFPQAVGYWTLGAYYLRNGRLEEGVAHVKKANAYFKRKGNLVLMSESLLEIGNGYFLSGDYKEGIKFYLESLRVGSRSSDKTLAYAAKLSLGHSYCAIGDTAVGVFNMLQYKDEALKDKKFEAVANAYALLGMIEMDRNNIPLSREYYEKNILYSGRSTSKTILSHAYNNKAILHYNIDELDSSLVYFRKSLDLRKRLKQNKDIIESYFNIASYYQGLELYDSSLYYFDQSIDLSNECGYNVDEVDALSEKILIYEALGDSGEVERANKRISYLSTFISDQESLDDEVLDYAEKILSQTEAKTTQSAVKPRSYSFIWLLLGGVVVLILFGVYRRN